jgi:Na+/H+ antiporter NhaD/arsenite permease-like protein
VTGAILVFVATYLVIASRQLDVLGLDRPSGALVGAVAMVVVGGLGFDDAMAALDLPVLTLLFAMLVIAAYLDDAKFFRYSAYLVLTRRALGAIAPVGADLHRRRDVGALAQRHRVPAC